LWWNLTVGHCISFILHSLFHLPDILEEEAALQKVTQNEQQQQQQLHQRQQQQHQRLPGL
jgi:prefoldin subunit 5